MSFQTTDLCDAHEGAVSVVEPMFQSFGGKAAFSGRISTVKCFEDNSLVREALGKPGGGRVLVVDGGGSLRCALLGDQIAALAEKNRWEGVVVYGCIRDSDAVDRVDIGVRALATHPLKSVKKGVGETDVPVTFGGVTFRPGHYLYADADGIIVAATPLT
ncbi:MAG TPA: ribonuclease E activity regulator RraA [Burkholderiales bacterium]|nr:ribonuclease E activity regulator RraA [Burkholderiales bacterium]